MSASGSVILGTAFAALTITGCAREASPARPPTTSSEAGAGAGVPLRGAISDAASSTVQTTAAGPSNVSTMQPFQMASAWGVPQGGRQGTVAVNVFERALSAAEACSNQTAYVGRRVSVHLQWPLPPGSTHSTRTGTFTRPAIQVGGTDRGSAENRWEGEVRVVRSSPDAGVIWIQAADEYFPGIRFRGHLDGDIAFTMCPPR